MDRCARLQRPLLALSLLALLACTLAPAAVAANGPANPDAAGRYQYPDGRIYDPNPHDTYAQDYTTGRLYEDLTHTWGFELPDGWQLEPLPADAYNSVAFATPDGTTLFVQTFPTNGAALDDLIASVRSQVKADPSSLAESDGVGDTTLGVNPPKIWTFTRRDPTYPSVTSTGTEIAAIFGNRFVLLHFISPSTVQDPNSADVTPIAPTWQCFSC